MNRPYLAWYVPLALLAIVPVGARLLVLRSAHAEPVDPAMAEAGDVLFNHVWTRNDPLANGGDGLGPVFNADSCFACHNQGGSGGAGGIEHNVTTFAVRSEIDASKSREGVLHAHAIRPEFQDNLAQIHADLPASERPDLRRIQAVISGDGCHDNRFPQAVSLSQRNTPPLFGTKLIDEIPDRVIVANERSQRLKYGLPSSDGEEVPVGRALRLTNGRIGHFGWKGQVATLSDFVQTACANELGLSNPDHPQPKPLGMPDYGMDMSRALDLTLEQCNQLTAFIGSLPRPVERVPDGKYSDAVEGKKLFHSAGCAECHTPDLGSVQGLYSDLLLHNMGQPLVGGGSYGQPPIEEPKFKAGEGPQPGEWRTPPLWGVADSAPYLHDGRAATLEIAVRMHSGQGLRSAKNFNNLSASAQQQLIVFLQTLRAP